MFPAPSMALQGCCSGRELPGQSCLLFATLPHSGLWIGSIQLASQFLGLEEHNQSSGLRGALMASAVHLSTEFGTWASASHSDSPSWFLELVFIFPHKAVKLDAPFRTSSSLIGIPKAFVQLPSYFFLAQWEGLRSQACWNAGYNHRNIL